MDDDVGRVDIQDIVFPAVLLSFAAVFFAIAGMISYQVYNDRKVLSVCLKEYSELECRLITKSGGGGIYYLRNLKK